MVKEFTIEVLLPIIIAMIAIIGVFWLTNSKVDAGRDATCKKTYGSGYQYSGGGYSNDLCIGPNGEIKGFRR